MAALYAAMTAILVIAFAAFLIEEALRSVSGDEAREQNEPKVKLI